MALDTKPKIASRALRKLGSQIVTNLADTTDVNAIIMNDLFDDSLSFVLSEGFWGFARKRVLLSAPNPAQPAAWDRHGLSQTYLVPSDFVRLEGWSSDSAIVFREGPLFRSDTAELGIIYTYLNTTIAEYPRYFTEALIDRLVLDAGYALTQDKQTIDYLEIKYDKSVISALAKDQQDQTQNTVRCDSWDYGRHTGILDNRDGGLQFR